jgi:acetyl-CoA carboxylase carboxyl transferase subunit alpha
MEAFLEFEKPIFSLEKRLQDLRELAKQEGVDFSAEIRLLEGKVKTLTEETFASLTPWQRVQLSRHPARPYARDYVDALFPDFLELHGDRAFGDDQAILGGVGTWKHPGGEVPVMILGHQKGRSTKQKMERLFGMARPEGYRKAMRLMALADRAGMPIITFIDTPGAYPGVEAEERGQSQAIAESIRLMFGLKVPVIAVVIGEGGSGGALAIGVANAVLMQEYSTYSVISPESCASILWSDSGLAERASEKLKMGPRELRKLGVIDAIVEEPAGGAHRDPAAATELLRRALAAHLNPFLKAKKADHRGDRMAKFRAMGAEAFTSTTSPSPASPKRAKTAKVGKGKHSRHE